MRLSDEQLDRYARHIVLKEVGGTGQQALLAGRVAVIGAGGIGAPVIQYLAAAGVGTLTVIDDDVVALSNLQRQTLFTQRDVGAHKVAMVANAVARLNRDVTVRPVDRRIDAGNAAELLAGAQVVVDGSDNFATRLCVADAALALRIPLVSAAVSQFDGQLAVYRGWEPGQPCYRCFVGDDPEQPEMSCADVGVLGAMAGVIGSLAALEALRVLVGFGPEEGRASAGKLLLLDGLTFRMRAVLLPRDPACMCHG